MSIGTRSIAYSSVGSPVGRVYVAHDGYEALAIRPAGDPRQFESWFEEHVGGSARPAVMPGPVGEALDAAISGRTGRRPSLSGRDDFERLVLTRTFEIPRGQVRSYGWLAAQIGGTSTARDVGAVLADNRLPLIVPCHRVVRSDWQLGWYNCGGRRAKRAMLAYEGVDVGLLDDLVGVRARYVASNTTRVFCHPSCPGARRITAQHRVLIESAAAAEAAGYRACRICGDWS
jgi:O-6-methylguanine DNA methyltransferase